MSLLDLDLRWRRLLAMGGPVDIGFEEPSDWPHGARGEMAVLEAGEDRLSADLCRLGERRFLRAIVALEIAGSEGEVAYLAPWAEVPHATFYAYLAHATEGAAVPVAVAGQLANALPDVEEGALMGLDFATGGARPIGHLDAFAAPVSFEVLLGLYAALDQDLRAELTRGRDGT
jgi:hypothetical protein